MQEHYVQVYKETKYVAIKDEVTNDTYVEGNLVVKGYLYVEGEVGCFNLMYGYNDKTIEELIKIKGGE